MPLLLARFLLLIDRILHWIQDVWDPPQTETLRYAPRLFGEPVQKKSVIDVLAMEDSLDRRAKALKRQKERRSVVRETVERPPDVAEYQAAYSRRAHVSVKCKVVVEEREKKVYKHTPSPKPTESERQPSLPPMTTPWTLEPDPDLKGMTVSGNDSW